MNERPKIKLELTTIDKTFEFAGWFLIVTIGYLVITNYSTLPNTIATHYTMLGEADGFGNKSIIFTLPIIATILFLGMTILNKFPHIFNYPTTITKENALKQYTNATRLIRYLKLSIVIIFGLIAYQTIKHTSNKTYVLENWFLPLTIALIFIPLLYFILKSFKINNTQKIKQ